MIREAVTDLSAVPLAAWVRTLKRSPLNERLMKASGPDLVSFALGLPGAELFPAATFAQAFQQALSADAQTLQ